MMRRVSFRALGALLCSSGWAVVGGVLGAASLGCSGTDVSRIQANVPASAGQLQLALSTRGASGSLYRLRQALFQVVQLDAGPFGGFASVLSSEDDPLASRVEASLPTGEYVVELFGGWFLEKVENGVVTPVVARLVSASAQSVTIRENEESVVSYRFQTNGEIIDFSEGRLIVDIQVEEGESGPGPDPVPPLERGEPLEILSGAIAPGSNPHGIAAGLFTVVSPLNGDLQVTRDSGALCFEGSLGAVTDLDFANQWGAMFGFAFTSGDGTSAVPWDLDAGNVVGFSFTVSGRLPPLRFGALPSGADPNIDVFCTGLAPASGATVDVPIGSLRRDCWNPEGERLFARELVNITWTLPADATLAHSFDFCVSDLRPLLRPGPAEPPSPPVSVPAAPVPPPAAVPEPDPDPVR